MGVQREDEAQRQVDGHVVGRRGDHERSRSEYGQDDGALVVSLEHDLGAVDVEQVFESRRLGVVRNSASCGPNRRGRDRRETRKHAQHDR